MSGEATDAIVNIQSGDGFSLEIFTTALDDFDIDLPMAVAELEKCTNNKQEIVNVYNGNGNVLESPLYLILNAKSNAHDKVDPKRLLAHPVMRKVVRMKWENFAKRAYLEQLTMHCMFVMVMALSASMSRNYSIARSEASDGGSLAFHTQLMFWLYLGSMLLILLVALRWYSPSYSLKWMGCTLLALLVWLCVLHFYSDSIASLVDWTWFVRINNIILALIAMYYLAMELKEFLADPDLNEIKEDLNCFPRMPLLHNAIYYSLCVPVLVLLSFIALPFVPHGDDSYFGSAFNIFQIPTYLTILFYVLNQFVTIITGDAPIYLGIILSFILWVLSLEYLQVHSTAGYLLPMMRAMASDMIRFLTFYAPFQFAYTCAYYLLFQGSNEPTYDTIGEAFITTCLVVLGQIDLDPFKKLTGASYVLGYILLLTHATLVIVMLLNVIVAMMTKTMDASLEKAKMKALISFAESVLRCEKTTGLKPIEYVPPEKPMKTQSRDTKEVASIENSDDESDVESFTSEDDSDDDEIEFELEESSTDTRIERLEEKLSTTTATLKQVLEILLESKKNQ